MTTGFANFCFFYIPMGILIGFAAAAIGASPWPFVVPILLSFTIFSDFNEYDSILSTIVISVWMDFANCVFLAILYNRQGKVFVKQGLTVGVIAAIPAVPGAILAQYVLPDFQDLLKELSGFGLFLFAIIFFAKGFKERKRLKGLEEGVGQQGEDALTGPKNTSSLGLEGRQDEEAHGSTQAEETSKKEAGVAAIGISVPAGESGSTNALVKLLSPQGGQTDLSNGKVAALMAVFVATGALAGFIGFGGGILFATIFIVVFDYEIAEGTATACLSTSVLMGAVLLTFIPQIKAFLLKYIAVGVGSSLTGATIGYFVASKLGVVQIYAFVGVTLLVCGVVACVPVFLK